MITLFSVASKSITFPVPRIFCTSFGGINVSPTLRALLRSIFLSACAYKVLVSINKKNDKTNNFNFFMFILLWINGYFAVVFLQELLIEVVEKHIYGYSVQVDILYYSLLFLMFFEISDLGLTFLSQTIYVLEIIIPFVFREVSDAKVHSDYFL
ncbi:hypothetical protein D3C87_1693020 [compost metagenome]